MVNINEELKKILPRHVVANVDWHLQHGRDPVQKIRDLYQSMANQFTKEIAWMQETGRRPNDSTGTYEDILANDHRRLAWYNDLVSKIDALVAEVNALNRYEELDQIAHTRPLTSEEDAEIGRLRDDLGLEACNRCKGTGELWFGESIQCPECGGRGVVRSDRE